MAASRLVSRRCFLFFKNKNDLNPFYPIFCFFSFFYSPAFFGLIYKTIDFKRGLTIIKTMARTLTRILKKKLDPDTEKILWEMLLREIRRINSVGRLRKFCNKFLTKDAAVFILRRLAVIKLIQDKKRYREIKNILDVSGNTISAAKTIILEMDSRKNKKTR